MSDGNDFAELLWENGHAVVHGRRRLLQDAFPPFSCGGAGAGAGAGSSSSRVQEKQTGISDPVALFKAGGIFGAGGLLAPPLHDFSSALDATRDSGGDLDDTVPWIHYPIIDDDSAAPALADSFSPDFFSELQAAATAAAANLTSLPPAPSVHHYVTTTNNNRSNTGGREPEPVKESHHHGMPARPEPQAGLTAAKQAQPRPGSGGSGGGLMNFSLFSRPAAMARASLQRAQRPPHGTADKLVVSNNATATASTRVDSSSSLLQASCGPGTSPGLLTDQRAAWPQPQPQHKEARFACAAAPARPAAGNHLQQEMPRDRDRGGGNNVAAAALQKKVEAKKATEATVATSSVCSGNGAGIGNDESWRQHKRKCQQAECSVSQDDDLEDESGGGMRISGSRGMKRSRTAEVHNLSERRRRDRINEKMRALQELIPNCNKIDKASMLDEAIEYLKTLQLQVQMMSMGSGLCIPPMLLPAAMQHLQIPPFAHFPHLGMGLGYGMGVFDMNGTAAVPLPPMPGAHFPCSMIPGAAAAHGLGTPGRNTVPMFGVPGQAIHPSATTVQPFPALASHPVRPNLTPQVSATMANMVQEQEQGIANQQQQSLNNEARQGANTGDQQLQTILQVENQHFCLPTSTQTESGQFLGGGGNRTTLQGQMGLKHKHQRVLTPD